MKKTIILALSLMMTIGIFSQQYKDWSRLSFTLEGGINRFDGDVKQNYGREVWTNAKTKLTLGGSVEYTLTPAWSMGLDYYYLPLSADTRPDGGYYSFDTKMNNVSLYASLNVLKAFFPSSTNRWGLWGGFGMGYSMHKINYETDNPDGTRVNAAGGITVIDKDYINNKGRSMFVPLHLLLEYNLTNNIALGAKAQYRGFFVDDLDGRIRPNANDALEFATLQIRYKLRGSIKNHSRNLNQPQYQENALKSDLEKLQNQTNNVIVPVDQTDRLNDLDRRVQKMEDILCPDGPDSDGDGVPDCRDKEPNTVAGNQVDFWGRTISTAKAEDLYNPSAFVYFDFDKTNIDLEAHKAIQIAANKLKADPTLIVEVRGFTDNMGSDEYNLTLSQGRADKVKHELITTHGIAANRIVANGKGKYNSSDRIESYKPYRTCIFFYNK